MCKYLERVIARDEELEDLITYKILKDCSYDKVSSPILKRIWIYNIRISRTVYIPCIELRSGYKIKLLQEREDLPRCIRIL